MLQLLAISTLGVFLRHPELLKPVRITTRSSTDVNELPTALAERNIPTYNNYVSTDGSSALLNYDQDDMIEPTTGSTIVENYSFGMFMGRSFNTGKP